MSQILRDLNKLAKKVGAPVVGQNISEQIRALNTFWEASSHGANIAERINETAHSKIDEGGSPAVLIEKSVTANDVYNAADDNADGYSKVTVNVQPEFYATPAAFSLVKNIKDIDVIVPSEITSIASSGFENCVGLKSISLPSSCTALSSNAFKGCTSLKQIDISMLTNLSASSAFSGCTNLENVEMPETFGGGISNYFFYNCSSLKNIIIPRHTSPTSGGNKIGDNAFTGCSALEWIKFKNDTAITVSSSAISGLPTTTKILVPLGSYGDYTMKQYYPSPSTNLYLCYANYESGAALPATSTDNYNLTWYASIADAVAETNPITTGNGEEVYARCTAQ